jgi:transcriptional regulator with XRE-family HTH domain
MQPNEQFYDPAPIVRAIADKGLTNEKVGVGAGLAARTVSAVRSGTENLQLETLFKVAAEVGLKVEISFLPMDEAETANA